MTVLLLRESQRSEAGQRKFVLAGLMSIDEDCNEWLSSFVEGKQKMVNEGRRSVLKEKVVGEETRCWGTT